MKQKNLIFLPKGNWTRMLLSLVLLMVLTTGMTFAQKAISGKVTDETGATVPGVSVIVKGTTTGTVTDMDGKYSLNAPSNAQTLTFSFVGMVSTEMPIGQNTVINVSMKSETIGVEEVVVVGYGVQKKKDITGSVTVVDVAKLKETPASNFGQQLQGKAAGVTVGSQGAPGSSTMVRIRGIGTVNNNGPLYVIDGVSTRSQNLNSINPNDIESVQILKDASSASIYGAQASNGVIILTTKKGKSGTPKVTYDGYYSTSQAAPFYDLLNSRDRVNLEWKAKLNAASIRGTTTVPTHPQFGTGLTPTFPKYVIPSGSNGPFTVTNWTPTNRITEFSEGTNWYKESTKNAPTQSHQLTVSGANDAASYLFGLNYFDQDGTFIYTYYKRYAARLNTEFKIRKWLRMGENLTLTFSKANRFTDQGEGNALSQSYRMVPWVPVYDIAGNFAGSKANGAGNGASPVANLTRAKDNFNTDLRVFGNMYAEADLLPGLKLRTSFGIDHTRYHYYNMNKNNPEHSESAGRNQFSEGAGFNYRTIWTNTLNYEKLFKEVHSFKLMAGSEYIQDGVGRSLSATRFSYLFENNIDTWTLDNGGTKDMSNNSSWNSKYALFGIFGRVDYAFKNRYLLTGIVRRDGVSRFSSSNRYGVFPSISAGWRISQENFMQSMTWLDDMKIRAGFGVTGNAEIPRGSNWATEYVTDPGRSNYDFGGSQTTAYTGFILNKFANLNTKWENTQMLNVGFDATFLKGMFDANIEYYIRKTSDMLVRDNYSALAGSGESPYVNLGDMENRGWDFAINHQHKIGKVGYDIGINISIYKNKVIKLNQESGTRFWGGGTRFGSVNMTEKGAPVAMFYGYNILGFYESAADVTNYKGTTGDRAGKSVLPVGIGLEKDLFASQWVGKYRFQDVNGDGKINADDKTVIGNPHPDFTGGFNLGLNYSNFDLSAFFVGSVGNDIFNYVKYWTDFQSFEGNRSVTMRDKSWEPGKAGAVLPILDYQDNISNKDANSYYVEDGSYLRLQTMSLGYKLPKHIITKAGFESCRIYLQGSNLFTATKYTGLDPEISNQDLGDGGDLTKGVDWGRWPQSKQFLIGINLVF
jgi:TonB-linked SusC/RagA family outer membrane protein